MDLWRILLIGVVTVGVVLLLLPGPTEISGLTGGTLIEEGTYVIERAGQRVGEEAFAVWIVDSGFRVESTARFGDQVIKARLVLDPSWNPVYYSEEGRTPVSVTIAEGKPRISVGSGLFRRTTALSAFPPFAIVGTEAIGPWLAIYRYLQVHARFARVETTAVLTGKRTNVALVGVPPEEVGLLALEWTLPAERYQVHLLEQEMWLYGQGELLLAMDMPSAGLVFYMKEMLPDGLHVAP